MPTTQIRQALTMGNLTGTPAAATQALNAANTWLGFSFTFAENKTLSKIKIYCTTATASLAASDLVAHIYDNAATSHIPGTSLTSSATVTTTPTNVNTPLWVEWTGFGYSLTAGKIYWLVLKNVNASPGTVNATFQWFQTVGSIGLNDSSNSNAPWTKKLTTDGSTWGTAGSGIQGIRFEFSDGSFEGLPLQATQSNASADGVYSAREVGSYFTLPANASINVRGVAMLVIKASTPTGLPVFNIRVGASPGSPGTPDAQTLPMGTAVTDFISGSIHYAYFASPYNMLGGNIYRVTLAEQSQSDGSANRYNTMVNTINSDAASKALGLFGSCQKTYFDGSNWAQTDTDYVPFYLILDTDTPFL